jgi:hypothetical protein
MALSAAYSFPILVSVIGGRRHVKSAPWSLGRFGYAINLVVIVWVPFACVIFSMPTVIPVTPECVFCSDRRVTSMLTISTSSLCLQDYESV